MTLSGPDSISLRFYSEGFAAFHTVQWIFGITLAPQVLSIIQWIYASGYLNQIYIQWILSNHIATVPLCLHTCLGYTLCLVPSRLCYLKSSFIASFPILGCSVVGPRTGTAAACRQRGQHCPQPSINLSGWSPPPPPPHRAGPQPSDPLLLTQKSSSWWSSLPAELFLPASFQPASWYQQSGEQCRTENFAHLLHQELLLLFELWQIWIHAQLPTCAVVPVQHNTTWWALP